MNEAALPLRSDASRPAVPLVRYVHEAAFALNLSLVAIALFYVATGYTRLFQPIAAHLEGMDRAISLHLHPVEPALAHPKDTLTGGYFAFFIPAITLALVIWMLLRLFSSRQAIKQTLRSSAGFLAVGAVPAWFLVASYMAEQKLFRAPGFYELVIALSCVALYLNHRWPVPTWGSIAL